MPPNPNKSKLTDSALQIVDNEEAKSIFSTNTLKKGGFYTIPKYWLVFPNINSLIYGKAYRYLAVSNKELKSNIFLVVDIIPGVVETMNLPIATLYGQTGTVYTILSHDYLKTWKQL